MSGLSIYLLFLTLAYSLSLSRAYYYTVQYESCEWSYRPNPEDCGSYFQCNFGHSILRQCPAGLHWNAKVNTCDWIKSSRCRTLQEIEDDKDIEQDLEPNKTCNEGEYIPSPTDCNKYLQCNFGNFIQHSCPPTLHWNPKANTCDWPYNAGCKIDGTPTSSTTIRTTSTSPPASPPEESTTKPPPDTTIVGIITEPPTTSTQTEEPNPGEPSPFKVICYYTGWSTYRQGVGKFTPSNIDPSLCTHIIYAFAVLDSSEWTIKIADTWMDLDNKYYEQVTNFKKDGCKVTIAVGGWNDSEGSKWSTMLRDPAKLTSFILSVVAFIKKYNFDGVDLDFEYPVCPWGICDPQYSTDKSGFTALVLGLRKFLPSPYIVSAAVSCNKNIIDEGYDVSTISKYLDWIGVMDYDIHGSWEKRTGHIAQMYSIPGDTHDFLNVNSSMSHWMARGAPASKLIMGIPLYGNSFTLADPEHNELFAATTGPGEKGMYSNQGGILSYYEICSKTWPKKVQDKKGRMGPYLVDGNQWVSYDDQGMIRQKTKYIQQKRLGGAMIWSLDFDDFRGICGQGKYPLLRTVHDNLAAKSTWKKSRNKQPRPIRNSNRNLNPRDSYH